MSRLRPNLCLALLAALLAASAARAADIVTLPTANQTRAKDLELAYYRFDLDYPPGAPTSLGIGTAYLGVTDWLEIDAWWLDPNKGGDKVQINPSILLMRESLVRPSIVIGAQDITSTFGQPSYYIAAAKNVIALPTRGLLPVVRLHLGVGTKANEGVFGGVQVMLTRRVGAIALYSQNDGLLGGDNIIAGLTYNFPVIPLVLKGGVAGKHTWVGIAYTLGLSRWMR